MPRRNLIRQNTHPYHITSRSNNKDWFSLPLEKVWRIALNALNYAYKNYPIDLHAFVLMHNHYHLVITTPDNNIDKFMQAFNKSFSERLKIASNHINRMFGGPYKWSIVTEEKYLYNVLRYVFQNPVRAGMVQNCHEYPFSTIYDEYLNYSQAHVATSDEKSLWHEYQRPTKSSLKIPIVHYTQESHLELLEWFNLHLESCQVYGLRRALKHAECQVKKERDSKILPTYEVPHFNT